MKLKNIFARINIFFLYNLLYYFSLWNTQKFFSSVEGSEKAQISTVKSNHSMWVEFQTPLSLSLSLQVISL